MLTPQHVDGVPNIEPRAVPDAQRASTDTRSHDDCAGARDGGCCRQPPAAGSNERDFSVRPFEAEATLMYETMVAPAQEHQVMERGRSSVGPMLDVMGVAMPRRASRK